MPAGVLASAGRQPHRRFYPPHPDVALRAPLTPLDFPLTTCYTPPPMLLRGQNSGHLCNAELRTDHPASSYGIPVLVAAGVAYDTALAHLFWQIVEATKAERMALNRAGYRLRDSRRHNQEEAPHPQL